MKSTGHLNIIYKVSPNWLLCPVITKGALAGQLPGVVCKSTSQTAVLPMKALSHLLRGQSPLIVIDGIPQNISIFDFEEIESVSVLSALATAMYGPGVNGVLTMFKRGDR